MAELRFYLDSQLVDHPKNWKTIEKVRQRDGQIIGWFTEFTSVLEWVGTGYNVINEARIADLCGSVSVLIECRKSEFNAWETFIEGIINVETVGWGEENNCYAKAEVEQNACVSDFVLAYEKPFDFREPKTKSFSGIGSPGSNLPNIVEQINDTFEAPTGVSYNSLGYPDQYGAKIKDLFNNMIEWATDDCMSLESDFFDADYQPCIIRYEVTTAPSNGDTISLKLTDESWHNYEFRCEIDASWIGNWEKVLLGSVNDLKPSYFRANPFNVVHTTIGSTERFDIYCYYEVEIVSSSFGTGAGSVTKIQNQIVGGSGWYIGNGLMFTNQQPSEKGTAEITFKELFAACDGLADLGIQIIDNSGQKLKIERKEDILSTATSYTIRNVRNIKRSNNEARTGINIILGNEAESLPAYSGEVVGGMPIETTALKNPSSQFNCEVIEKTIDKKIWVNLADKMNLVCSEEKEFDQDFFIIDTELSGSTRIAKKYGYRYYDSVSSLSFENSYIYNAWLRAEALFKYQAYTMPLRSPLFTLSSDTENVRNIYTTGGGFSTSILPEDLESVPDNPGFSYQFAEFEAYLSNDDFNNIGVSQKLIFNPGNDG